MRALETVLAQALERVQVPKAMSAKAPLAGCPAAARAQGWVRALETARAQGWVRALETVLAQGWVRALEAVLAQALERVQVPKAMSAKAPLAGCPAAARAQGARRVW